MNPEKNGTGESLERYLRPLTFGILSIGIGLSLVLGSATKPAEVEATATDRVHRARSDVMFRLIVLQVVQLDSPATGAEQEFVRKTVLEQLNRLEEDPSFRGPQSEVQRRIILDYAGERIADLSREALGPYRESFVGLYERGKLPAETDPLLLLPASRLALLKYYRTADPARHETMLASARAEAAKAQLLLFGALGAFVVLSVTGGIIAWRFMARRPPSYLARFLETLSPLRRSALLESAIIYLFLVFPAGVVVGRLASEPVRPLVGAAVSLGAVIVAIWYFVSEAGGVTFRQTLWIPVVLGPQTAADATVVGDGAAPGHKTDTAAQLVLHSRPFPVAREILAGLAMTIVFAPLILLRVATTFLLGEPVEFPYAAPVTLQGNFWVVFVFAVVALPLVEEIVFRNWLYGALRFRFPLFGAALACGFLFAMLHPHGWWPFQLIAGTGLSLLREFRSGIVAPVVAHSVMNAAILGAAHLAAGG